MEKIPTSDVLIKRLVEGEVYEIWTAHHPEAGLPSYAVYNKITDVIENYQPNYANSLNVRGEFEEWYLNATKLSETKDLLDTLTGVDAAH